MGIPSNYEKYLPTQYKVEESNKSTKENKPIKFEKPENIFTVQKSTGTHIEKQLAETSESTDKLSFLDLFLSLLDIVGAITLIFCLTISFYHNISDIDPVTYDVQTNTSIVSINKIGQECIDGFMYDSFQMEVLGDDIFYAPEGSIKWDKNGYSKKRCTVYSLITKTSFSFTESPFLYSKTTGCIGGTEGIGNKLKVGDIISVNTEEVGSDILLNTYKTTVQLVQHHYSFKQDNEFTDQEIEDSKEIVNSLCSKKKSNVSKFLDNILPCHINNDGR